MNRPDFKQYDATKFFKVFRLGEHSRDITLSDLQEMELYYTPSFHTAVLMGRHDNNPYSEPMRLGDVAGLKLTLEADGYTLWASFSEVYKDIDLLTQYFTHPSIEVAKYSINGFERSYLRAIATTNFPQIKKLPALQFSEPEGSGNIKTFKSDFSTQTNQTIIMNERLKKLALLYGIDVSKFTDDASLSAEISKKFGETKTEIDSIKSKVHELEGKFGETKAKTEPVTLEERMTKLEEKFTKGFSELSAKDKAAVLLDAQVASGKIIPADKENYRNFAEADYDGAKKFFEGMKPAASNLGDAETVKNGAGAALPSNSSDPKFFSDDGKTRLTYTEILKNDLEDKFTEAELDKLRNEDKNFKK